MRYIADIPEYIVKDIRKRIEMGAYSNLESFILTALENQLALEREGHSSPLFSSSTTTNGTSGNSPHINLLTLVTGKSIKSVPPPTYKDLQLWGDPKNEEHLWMWGQINRLLPIKVALRALANQENGSSPWMALEEVSKNVVSAANSLGLDLLERDKQGGRLHGEKLSAAFPLGKDPEKSAKRFSSQFIGYLTTEGKFGGSLPFLRFAALKRESDKEWIGLTKAGVDFANLENPILDRKDSTSPISFGPTEVDFYLDHIAKNVPGEKQAFSFLLKIIADGITDREGIAQALRKLVGSNWSEDLLGTQRAGAMARMNELGLIERKKEGIEVVFSISARGKEFLRAN